MQRISIWLGLLALLMFTQCGKDECKEGFELGYENISFEIPAGANTFETHNFLIDNIPSLYGSFLDANGTDAAEVKAINSKYIRLISLSPGAEYDIIESAILLISADGLPEIEIAFLEPVPLSTGSVLELFPSLPDVKEYLEEDNFSLKVKIRFRQIPQQFIETRLEFGFLACLEI